MTAILIILIVIVVILFIAYPLALRPNTRRREQMQPFEKVMIAHRGFFIMKQNIRRIHCRHSNGLWKPDMALNWMYS